LQQVLTLVSHKQELGHLFRNGATFLPVFRGIAFFVESTYPLPAL